MVAELLIGKGAEWRALTDLLTCGQSFSLPLVRVVVADELGVGFARLYVFHHTYPKIPKCRLHGPDHLFWSLGSFSLGRFSFLL